MSDVDQRSEPWINHMANTPFNPQMSVDLSS